MHDTAAKSNGALTLKDSDCSILGAVTSVSDGIPTDASSECGSMRISSSGLQYVGGDHWVAILDSIADLKDHLDREEQLQLAEEPDVGEKGNGVPTVAASMRPKGAFLLYGTRPTSRDEILSALPPRYAVDRYISHYFNYLDLVSSVCDLATVHGPSFLREASLHSALETTNTLADERTEEIDVEQRSLQVDLYREKTVQCLVMGQYTKSGPYVLETMINYIYVEFGTNPDAEKDMWFLLAIEVNLARRMGYHRDPSHFPGISPFQGEMRRRLWATVLLGDVLISNQMGMPRMISDCQYDTSEPRNLKNEDFDKDTTELPSSRPESELTTALPIIARTRMLKALGMVADLTSTVEPCPYREVLRVDRILHEAAKSIPSALRMKPLASSLTDSPQLIVARLFIHHMFLKGQVMLHRRFLSAQTYPQGDTSYEYSRRTCLDASLASLEIQHILDEETRPGGQLHAMRWRVTSIMNHQFLTATMLLCSLLYRRENIERENEIRAALHRARTIWMRRSSISNEAKKAAEAVSLVLSCAGGGWSEDSMRSGSVADKMQQAYHSLGDMVTQNDFSEGNLTVVNTNSNDISANFIPDLLETFMSGGPNLDFDVSNDRTHSNGWTAFVNWPELT
ncbi:putative transcription factor [Aspergillus mulundensis]|uniref:Xylanolytic transcriptional activator regulatory domain-containing protein n=1 Tax=Aspergillus mulundensis TaxID=1810919 RepID=A0A3D8S4M8_9EURO|nr:Uncharacterized protein DSM5745_04792 [Aspergillus mulundensis]RDW81235.1 Uncharacterized protein DSM5745_04792 [Aspergillus mulundensis]